MEEKKLAKTLERYERGWIVFALTMILVFLVLTGYTVSNFASYVPDTVNRVDPRSVRLEGEFANPRVEQVGPNAYRVYMIAQAFSFVPGEVRVPKGAEVTFYVTSPDVQHGFLVENTNINVQIIPGGHVKNSVE
ncbi:cytochrome c oxidase subunit II [Marinithermus hydrothermalis]|uniref:Cytochrome c oxidase subunit II n=1 Tax=Marinithermus hydrothermalis (strain DSM 14884 / JCM 11576 / T1) TaxID=869210 RepID=F2NQ10_MARHT|nr:cytochrome c oxidase subunit II [Marinithermus hydrothermalis]AEB11111.1 cytochrome c oxidase subunit II [Marinithermus hydrothermalis DSM 14884]